MRSGVLPEQGSYIIKFVKVIEIQERQRTDYKTKEPLWDDDGNPIMEKTAYCQLQIDDPTAGEDDGYEFREYVNSYINIGSKGPTKSLEFASAFAGMSPQEYYAMAPMDRPGFSTFPGKKAQANLIHHTSTKGNTYLKIDSVVAMRKRKPTRQMIEDDDEPGF